MGKENIRWCRWECEKKSFKMFRIKSFWKKKNRLVPTCVLLFTRKTKHTKFSEKRTFLTPWYAHVRVRIRRQEMFVFRKIWRALFSCNARFEIRPFDLLPTIYTPLEVLPFSLREEFLNMEFFLVRIFHIQSKYGKIRPRKNSLFRLFSRKVSHFFFKFDVIWCLVDFLAIQLFWSLSKHFTYTVFPVELPCKSSFCINGFILIFENFGSYF